MRSLLLAGVVLFGAVGGGAGVAARDSVGPRPRAPPRGESGYTVDEFEVRPRSRCLAAKRDASAPAPNVVSSFPAEGEVVRPGLLVVRLTFDQPMTCSGYLEEIAPFPTPCPQASQNLTLSLDRRTLRTLCLVEPNLGYALRASRRVDPLTSLRGASLAPFDLTFRTSTAPPVTTVPEALALDPAWRGARRR